MSRGTTHYYYLHTETRDLIAKRRPIEPSDFTLKIWTINNSRRKDAWIMLIEAAALGADMSRVQELAERWSCDEEDLVSFLVRHRKPTRLQKVGMRIFTEEVLGIDFGEYIQQKLEKIRAR